MTPVDYRGPTESDCDILQELLWSPHTLVVLIPPPDDQWTDAEMTLNPDVSLESKILGWWATGQTQARPNSPISKASIWGYIGM